MSIFRQQHHAAAISLNDCVFKKTTTKKKEQTFWCTDISSSPLFSQHPGGGTILTDMPERTESCKHPTETSLCETAESASSGQWIGKTFFLYKLYMFFKFQDFLVLFSLLIGLAH